jgi:hypothetical protein
MSTAPNDLDRITSEVVDSYTPARLAPRDRSLTRTVNRWRAHLRTLGGGEIVGAEEPRSAPTYPPPGRLRHNTPLRVTRFAFPSTRAATGSVYLQQCIDEELGLPPQGAARPANLPTWQPARVAAEFFRDPSALVGEPYATDFHSPDVDDLLDGPRTDVDLDP